MKTLLSHLSRTSLLRVAARIVRDCEALRRKAETGEQWAAVCALSDRVAAIYARTAPTAAEYAADEIPVLYRIEFAAA